MLARVDETSADIADLETEIEELIAPFAQAVDTLDEIPGIGATAAHVILQLCRRQHRSARAGCLAVAG
jgi:transposase